VLQTVIVLAKVVVTLVLEDILIIAVAVILAKQIVFNVPIFLIALSAIHSTK
jgi:hypothetical protein